MSNVEHRMTNYPACGRPGRQGTTLGYRIRSTFDIRYSLFDINLLKDYDVGVKNLYLKYAFDQT